MSLGAGDRNQLIEIERAMRVTDDRGIEREDGWSALTTAWVAVRYGTGSERREAAANGAEQAATFIARWTPKLGEVTELDRIVFSGRNWNIRGIAPIGRNREIEFTAITRKD